MVNIDRFNDLVREKGVTKAFIASKLGKHQAIFSDWVKGKSKPTEQSLQIIADILGTTVAYLTDETDEKEATHNGQPLSSTKKLLFDKAKELSDDEIKKIIEYADFVMSQRKQ